jgi:hypothetical protein
MLCIGLSWLFLNSAGELGNQLMSMGEAGKLRSGLLWLLAFIPDNKLLPNPPSPMRVVSPISGGKKCNKARVSRR